VPHSLWLLWRLIGIRALKPPPPASILPALREASSLPVAFLTSRWVSIITEWVELVEARRAADYEGVDPVATAANLRMDEFVTTDLGARTAVVRATLTHLSVLDDAADADALAPALAAFNVHSQAGSAMAGPKGQVVQAADMPVMRHAVVSGLHGVRGTGVVVQDDGRNVLLPRSLGA